MKDLSVCSRSFNSTMLRENEIDYYLQRNHRRPSVNVCWRSARSVWNSPSNVRLSVDRLRVQLLMPYLMLLLNVAVVVALDRLSENQYWCGVKKVFVMLYKVPIAFKKRKKEDEDYSSITLWARVMKNRSFSLFLLIEKRRGEIQRTPTWSSRWTILVGYRYVSNTYEWLCRRRRRRKWVTFSKRIRFIEDSSNAFSLLSVFCDYLMTFLRLSQSCTRYHDGKGHLHMGKKHRRMTTLTWLIRRETSTSACQLRLFFGNNCIYQEK